MPRRNSLISRLCHRRGRGGGGEKGDGECAAAPLPPERTKTPSRRRRRAAAAQAATRSDSVARAARPTASKRTSQRTFVGTPSMSGRQHHFPKRARAPRAPAPELEGATSAVVWLNRALPDPTPPALRLK